MVASSLNRAWEADAYAKRVHTYEAWQVAADAFEAAGETRTADRIRRETARLRKNWSRRELLHVAVRAADDVLSRGKRPSEKLFARARSAAFEAIRQADRLAGTINHRSVRNSTQINALAARGVLLARQLHWTSRAPEWHGRIRS